MPPSFQRGGNLRREAPGAVLDAEVPAGRIGHSRLVTQRPATDRETGPAPTTFVPPVENRLVGICGSGDSRTKEASLSTASRTMTYTLEISDELRERLDVHLEEGETYEEFITELVSMYETDGTFLQEGYSE